MGEWKLRFICLPTVATAIAAANDKAVIKRAAKQGFSNGNVDRCNPCFVCSLLLSVYATRKS